MRTDFKRTKWWLLLLCLSSLGLSASATASADLIELDWKAPLAQEHPLVGGVFDSSGAITPEALADLLASSRFVLIGEKHDNIDHHQLELYLLKLLAKQDTTANAKPPITVALEMLNGGQQEQIDLVSEQLQQSEDLQIGSEELKSRLDWPEHGWPWEDYSAVIGWTLNARVPLYAGNISRKTMKIIYQNGIDDRFSSARELKATLSDALLDQVFDGHCGLMPKDSLASMVDIQLAKDAAMANALIVSNGKQSVLIAGNGHIRKDTSVPKHLQILSDDSIVTVALLEVDADKQSADEYDNVFDRFDIVIFTPIANQRDYCADLEKSMHKK